MKSNNRGQFTTNPTALWISIAFVVSIAVGINIKNSMEAQLPDEGGVLLCGGCGYAFDTMTLVVPVVLTLIVVGILTIRGPRTAEEE